MSLSDTVIRAKAVTNELNDVLSLFDISNNNADITTRSGRTYKVANVMENKDEGTWMMTHLVSRGMFSCYRCGNGNEPKLYEADEWTQFVHGEDMVKMHSALIHQFKEHPQEVSAEVLERVAKVFLG